MVDLAALVPEAEALLVEPFSFALRSVAVVCGFCFALLNTGPHDVLCSFSLKCVLHLFFKIYVRYLP